MPSQWEAGDGRRGTQEALGVMAWLVGLGGAWRLAPGVGWGSREGTLGDGRVPSPAPHPIAGAEEEFVAGEGRFSTASFVWDSGAAGDAGDAGAVGAAGVVRRGITTSSTPIGRRSCSSDPGGIRSRAFPSAIACCHTAPIGNLGMRTHATRHFDCTANLHHVMRSALLDRHLQHEWRAERSAAPLRRLVLACPGEAPS